MNEEKLFPEEYERRKKNMRPDALVIPEDVLLVMRIPKKDWNEELKSNVQRCIDLAKSTLFPDESLETVSLAFHQQIADRVIALAAVFASTNDENRIDYLRQIIANSQISARANYQFVRHFIRRSLAPIFMHNGLKSPNKWSKSLVSDSKVLEISKKYVDAFLRGTESGVEKVGEKSVQIIGYSLLTWLFLYLLQEASGFRLDQIVDIIVRIAKGEFEHFDEIKDELASLANTEIPSHTVDIQILKGADDSLEYVKTGCQVRNIKCIPWKAESPRIRYYAFPISHLLLFALGDGQFLAFTGTDPKAVQATHKLFLYDEENLVSG